MSDARTPLDRSAAATGLVTVVVANLIYLAGLPLILDPMISMEALYIQMAQRPLASIVTEDPAWGPLYAVWLKPFVVALGDPLAVYSANLYGLSLGVSVLIYAYLLLLTRRAAIAVGAALFFLVCDFNVPLSNKVSGFALMVILAGLVVSELLPAGGRRMTAATLGVLLASYARPELYPAALFLCLATIRLARRESSQSGRDVRAWVAASLASIVILALWIGTPLFGPYHSSDRLLVAFREHFAWNWSRWHNQWHYLFSIWDQEFPGAQTPLQAFLSNPRAVMHHLIDNLLGTARFMAVSAFDHYPLLAPASNPSFVTAESLLASAATLASLVFVALRSGLRRQMVNNYGHALFVYASVSACSLVSATVIFPLPHYLAIPGVLLMLAGTLAATLIIPAGRSLSWRRQFVAAVVCLAAVPKPFVLPSAYVVRGAPFKAKIVVSRTITDTVELIRSLGLPAPVHVLTATDGIGAMLGSGFHEVKVWQKGAQSLEAYMRDNDIGLVINLDAGRHSFMIDDPYWEQIQTGPETIGFTRVAVPSHEAVGVYLRTDLMRPQH